MTLYTIPTKLLDENNDPLKKIKEEINKKDKLNNNNTMKEILEKAERLKGLFKDGDMKL